MKKWAVRGIKLSGALVILALAVAFVGILWPLPVPEPNARAARLLLINVSLVDVESGLVRRGQNILIENGRILNVGSTLYTEDAQVIDAANRFAVPGMFDMHMHSIKLSPVLMHPLFVAAGVTAVRDMGGCLGKEDRWVACANDKRAWNNAVNNGLMVGPRYDRVTSLAINGGGEIPKGTDIGLGAATVAGAQTRVRFDKARGVDFLKPYTRLPRSGYFALAESARANDMYLAGHLPLAVSGLEAIDAGQRSFEHAFLFIWDCYPGMAELRGVDDPRSVYTDEVRRRMIAEHDAMLCSALHRKMKSSGAAFVPTHTTRKLDAYADDDDYRNDIRLKFVPRPLRLMWLQDADGMAKRGGPNGRESYRSFYRFGIEQTGVAHAAGVTVLAGTDAPDSFAFPGSGLHDELGHLVEAGLSPLDALRSATLEPSRFLGLAGKAGVIKPGARADIVLINRNPLDDIQALREIDTVVLAGVVYERDDLDRLLRDVEIAAGSWTMWPKFIWQILMSPIMRMQFAD